MNNCILIGRLTKDVLVQCKDNNLAFARFSIAIDRGKDKNGESRGADFPSCVAFGKTAENIAKYSGKGLLIALAAHVQTGKYDDRETGRTVYTTDFIVDRAEFLGWKQRDGQNAAQAANQGITDGIPDGFMAVSNEEIPF